MDFSEKDLSELGFEVVKDLNEREKRFISNFIANKLTDKYPYLKIGYFFLAISLLIVVGIPSCAKFNSKDSVGNVNE